MSSVSSLPSLFRIGYPNTIATLSPAVREAIVHNYRDWFTVPADDIRIQWPGSPNEMIEIDPVTGHRRPTDLFESYATTLENWSFDSKIIGEYPEILQYGARIRIH